MALSFVVISRALGLALGGAALAWALAEASLRAEPGETAPASLPQARRLYADGQYRQALAALRLVLAAEPVAGTALGARELLARVYFDAERYAEAAAAAREYRELLDALPDEARRAARDPRRECGALLGDALVQLGQPADAEREFSAALALAESGPPADPAWIPRQRLKLAEAVLAQGPAGAQRGKALLEAAISRTESLLAPLSWQRLSTEERAALTQVLSDAALVAGKPQQAVAALRRLLAEQDQPSEARAKSLSELARACHAAQQADEEREQLLAAIALRRQLAEGQASAEVAELLERVGVREDADGRPAQAERAWREAAELLETVCSRAAASDRDRARQATDLQVLQSVYQRLQDWRGALRVGQRLLAYRQDALPATDPAIFRAQAAIGALQAKLGDYPAARRALEPALAFWRRQHPRPGPELAGTLNNLAEVDRATGNFARAKQLFAEALPLLESLLEADDVKLAEAHSNLASVLSALGQYKPALDHYLAAEGICRQRRHASSARVEEVLSTALLNLAALYKSQRQFAEAAEYCGQALELRRRRLAADSPGLLPYYAALAALHLAYEQSGLDAAQSRQRLLAARQFADRAQEIVARRGLAEEPETANLLVTVGQIAQRQKDAPQARRCWQEARRIADRSGQLPLSAKALTYLALLELEAKNLAAADKLSAEAVAIQQRVEAYPALHSIALVCRARVERALGRKAESLATLARATELVEAPRAATTGAEAERADYFAQFAGAFDLLVDWNAEAGDFAAALSAAEAGRNRTFLDQVRAAGVDLRRSLAGDRQRQLVREQDAALATYHQLQEEARQAAARGDEAAVARVAGNLAAQRQRYARLEKSIRDESPFYRDLLARHAEPEQWSALAPMLVGPRNLVAIYYLGQLKSHLFLVGPGEAPVAHFALEVDRQSAAALALPAGPLTRGAAIRLVARYLNLLRRDGDRERAIGGQVVTSRKFALAPEHAPRVTDVLLPPAARALIGQRAADYLVVVPDGALHQLPLESLATGATTYLFDELPPVAYAPSAMISAALASRPAASGAAGGLLTVGNPHYPPLAESAAGRAPQLLTAADYLSYGGAGALSELPATRDEIRRVAAAFQPWSAAQQVTLLDEDQASERNVRQHVAGRRFVHLAAHGLVDEQLDNLFGAIALTPPARGALSAEDDGFLSLFEIYRLPLADCELAVLSACRTNAGPDRPLEAGSTMARAFLAAGARRVVCSHWNVDDESTAELIGQFMEQVAAALRRGEPVNYAHALYRARQRVRRNEATSSPYQWAPLVLVGPAE